MAILQNLGKYKDAGLLLMRIGLGASLAYIHGLPKIKGGPELWGKIGNSMSDMGVHFLPIFWGFMASATELAGGVLIILGWLFRPASFLILFTMVVAVVHHIAAGDSLSDSSHAIDLAFVYLGLMIIGPGKYSIDKK